MESQNIRCHELQAGDNLPELIADFQSAYAVAVVLINTSENYFLHSSFLTGTRKSNFPVLMLTRSDGIALMNTVKNNNHKVFAKIAVESFVDSPGMQVSMETLQNPGNGPTPTNSDIKAAGQCLLFA